MLSAKYVAKDLEEENPLSNSSKWMTMVVVQLQPIAPCSSEKAAVDPALEAFEAIVRDVMAEHGGKMASVGQDTLATVFSGNGDNIPDVWQGVRAAFAVMEKLGDQNRRRSSQDQLPIRVGIGVHSGPAPANAPTEQLSAVPQEVSKAEGLSVLNRQSPFPAIFISKNALKRLDDNRGYHIHPLGEAPVHNQHERMPVFAMMYASQSA